jgi:hypothetical protein
MVRHTSGSLVAVVSRFPRRRVRMRASPSRSRHNDFCLMSIPTRNTYRQSCVPRQDPPIPSNRTITENSTFTPAMRKYVNQGSELRTPSRLRSSKTPLSTTISDISSVFLQTSVISVIQNKFRWEQISAPANLPRMNSHTNS